MQAETIPTAGQFSEFVDICSAELFELRRWRELPVIPDSLPASASEEELSSFVDAAFSFAVAYEALLHKHAVYVWLCRDCSFGHAAKIIFPFEHRPSSGEPVRSRIKESLVSRARERQSGLIAENRPSVDVGDRAINTLLRATRRNWLRELAGALYSYLYSTRHEQIIKGERYVLELVGKAIEGLKAVEEIRGLTDLPGQIKLPGETSTLMRNARNNLFLLRRMAEEKKLWATVRNDKTLKERLFVQDMALAHDRLFTWFEFEDVDGEQRVKEIHRQLHTDAIAQLLHMSCFVSQIDARNVYSSAMRAIETRGEQHKIARTFNAEA